MISKSMSDGESSTLSEAQTTLLDDQRNQISLSLSLSLSLSHSLSIYYFPQKCFEMAHLYIILYKAHFKSNKVLYSYYRYTGNNEENK